MKASVFLAYPAPPHVIEKAQQKFNAIIATKTLNADEILQEALQIKPSAIVVTPSQKMTAEIISSLPDSVKIIATSSVGFDHLNVSAAKERKILLSNTPDVLTECTADLAMMLMLNACRRGREYMEIMNQGWSQNFSQSEMLGLKVSGKTLGIFGMGRIGQAVADRARGFGMKIIYHNTKRLPKELEKDATYFADLKKMLPHCQILSLNAPGTEKTRNIMNDETLALLPQNAVLVNVARGTLVDEDALIRALKSGHLFAAGLDVFQQEPNYNTKLNELRNVFLTPHMGSATIETRDDMGFRALENIELALNNKPLRDPLS